MNLNIQEKRVLKIIQKTSKEKHHYVKVTVILMLDEGFSPLEIAKSLGLSDDTIYRYQKQFVGFPLDEYLKNNHSGRECFLTTVELEQLKQELEATLHRTTASVQQFILQTFHKNYTTDGIRKLLKRLNYSYKKTKQIPSKANPEKQELWIQDFEKLNSEKKEHEEIMFLDATHPLHNTQPDSAWIQQGQERTVLANAGRSRLNINGIVNVNHPTQLLIQVGETINAQTNIQLFEKLIAQNSNKKFIIYSDNARYNHALILKAWLTENQEKIELRYLPPYSPNLNPIERVWKFMKKTVTKSKFYEKFDSFKNAVLEFFDNISIYKVDLEALVTTNFQRI